MKLHCLVLLVTFGAQAIENKGNIGLQGEISLKIQVPGEADKLRKRTKEQDESSFLEEVELEVERQHIAGAARPGDRQGADGRAARPGDRQGTDGRTARPGDRQGADGRTVAPVLECTYQQPEEAHSSTAAPVLECTYQQPEEAHSSTAAPVLECTYQQPEEAHSSTAAPVLECTYQQPEEAQVHALLGNMMNQLTKMFVRASDMLKSEGEVSGARRKGDSRFKVVSQTNSHFFEEIYRKMTQQYLSFYNSTALRAEGGDPCQHQQEMKAMWKDLLDTSLATFRQAAFRCMDEKLRAAGSGGETRARSLLAQYVARELRKIRLGQLALLCDRFQLCYHELLRRTH